jgi:hypothetical protein
LEKHREFIDHIELHNSMVSGYNKCIDELEKEFGGGIFRHVDFS